MITFSFARVPEGSTLAQRLEREGDLIGGCYEATRSVPEWQFRKRRAEPPGASPESSDTPESGRWR
jgi:hypothetical protein